MFLVDSEVVASHCHGRTDVSAWPKQQLPPLSGYYEIGDVKNSHEHEQPHESEVPVNAAGEPAAESSPKGEHGVLEGIREIALKFRKKYAMDKTRNTIHASDNEIKAKIELNTFEL